MTALHPDMRKTIRDQRMRAFRAGDLQLLVVTDALARGFDCPALDLVVNLGLPNPEIYQQRWVGRAA
jgi:superfamily II DNA/RNA helicase